MSGFNSKTDELFVSDEMPKFSSKTDEITVEDPEKGGVDLPRNSWNKVMAGVGNAFLRVGDGAKNATYAANNEMRIEAANIGAMLGIPASKNTVAWAKEEQRRQQSAHPTATFVGRMLGALPMAALGPVGGEAAAAQVMFKFAPKANKVTQVAGRLAGSAAGGAGTGSLVAPEGKGVSGAVSGAVGGAVGSGTQMAVGRLLGRGAFPTDAYWKSEYNAIKTINELSPARDPVFGSVTARNTKYAKLPVDEKQALVKLAMTDPTVRALVNNTPAGRKLAMQMGQNKILGKKLSLHPDNMYETLDKKGPLMSGFVEKMLAGTAKKPEPTTTQNLVSALLGFQLGGPLGAISGYALSAKSANMLAQVVRANNSAAMNMFWPAVRGSLRLTGAPGFMQSK